jgi:hypothetical protein
MPTQDMYVVMAREHGMFVVEPVPGMSQREAIEHATGLGGGYTAGLQQVELPANVNEVWMAWVETKLPNGRLSFDFRTFPPDLTAEKVEEICRAAAEEPLKVHLSQIHWAPPATPSPS